MNPRAVSVDYKSPYQLIIAFTNGKVKQFDLQPYLHYPIYQSLQNEIFCSRARIKFGTVIWNEEIDMDPDLLFLESREMGERIPG